MYCQVRTFVHGMDKSHMCSLREIEPTDALDDTQIHALCIQVTQELFPKICQVCTCSLLTVGESGKVYKKDSLVDQFHAHVRRNLDLTFSMIPPCSPQSYGTRFALGTTIRKYDGWQSNINLLCIQLICPSIDGKQKRTLA